MIKRTEVKKHKSKEMEALELVKQQEKERKANGYVWVTKNKTSKQVSKENLGPLLKDGWVRTS